MRRPPRSLPQLVALSTLLFFCRPSLSPAAGPLPGVVPAGLALAVHKVRDEAVATPRWWRGNTHTHTLNSDGDSSPGEVAHWYRDHGYDFLVLSDHNYYTEIDVLQRELDQEVKQRQKTPFLLIPGEEVSNYPMQTPIHLNAVGSQRLVGPRRGESKRAVIQKTVDAILAVGGVPQVNHPNFQFAITADDLMAIRNLRHFEIFNGHPKAQNFGGGGHPGLEEMWDDLLTRGMRIFGVAVDDAHDFQQWGPRQSNPGNGWIMVRAARLERDAIRSAFGNGDYYSTTGVLLRSVEYQAKTLRVHVQAEAHTTFNIFYVGPGGRLLARETTMVSSYKLKGEESYVRARIVSSRGEFAWTQPLFR